MWGLFLFFCFWHEYGSLPTAFPSVVSILVLLFYPGPSCCRAGGHPAFSVPTCLSNTTPRFRGRPPAHHTAPVEFWNAGSWASSQQELQVQWSRSGASSGVIIRGTASGITSVSGYESTASCSWKDKGCEVYSSTTGSNANFPHLLERTGVPPDNLIRSVFQRTYILVTCSDSCVVRWCLMTWIEYSYGGPS